MPAPRVPGLRCCGQRQDALRGARARGEGNGRPMIDTIKLAGVASDARNAARTAAKATKVDGAMSADSVHIPTGTDFPIKRRSAQVREALGGDSVSECESGLWRGYMIDPPGGGRANARLAACEAMAKVLKAYGASVFYQRD